MNAETAYTDALRAVEAHYGPVTDFCCIHCTDNASRWVVDNSASAYVDPKFRRYSSNPADYWPFCGRCARDYENSMADAPPVVFRRVNVFAERHWFTECFRLNVRGSVLLSDAYATYLDFSREERTPAQEVMSRLAFKKSLLRRGASQKRTNRGVAISGIELRSS
jgi:hypothetical protein